MQKPALRVRWPTGRRASPTTAFANRRSGLRKLAASPDRNVEPRSPLRRRDLWCRASMHYRLASHRATISLEACGRGAVGSAQPCQGWGRGFESRRPLDGADASTPAVEWPSGEATACKAVHTGSIPVSTSKMGPARLAQRESASLTRKRSLVQSQYRAPVSLQVRPGPRGLS
jgi:hypothetical protein